MSEIAELEKRVRVLVVLSLLVAPAVFGPVSAAAQAELTRKVKSRVEPTYPDIARRMSITGTVKVAVVVGPDGTVKRTKVVGGHPLLVNAALDAVKKWKFEPAPQEDSGIVEFKFQSQD